MNLLRILVLSLALSGCGGGDDSPAPLEEFTDVAPTFSLVGDGDYTPGPTAISHNPTQAGRYTFTLTGVLSTTSRASEDTARVVFSIAGSGRCKGEFSADYTVPAVGSSAAIRMVMQCELTGAGPWQNDVSIDLMQGKSTISVVGLTLKTARLQ